MTTPLYLVQARRAMASRDHAATQAAGMVALAEGVWRLTELLTERNRLLRPVAEFASGHPDTTPAVEDPGRYGYGGEGPLLCGALRDQTGRQSCGRHAGHPDPADHEWI
jgi:hypothetical protein